MLRSADIKKLIIIMVLSLSAVCVLGCNGDNGAEDIPQTEAENTGDNQPSDALPANENNNTQPAADNQTPEEPDNTPIAEKSPVAITRIEPENVQVPDAPVVTGEGEEPDDDTENNDIIDSDGDGVPDEHEHEPAPNLFPVDRCQVEVNGSYKKDLATEIIAQINQCRAAYGIGPLSRNTSLLACADTRAKEQTYFIGHFRPNGASWKSVAPDYVQGECIAVDYREAEAMIDAWYSVNDTRIQLMNPDYTQIGVSVYEVFDTYYIAAEFAY